MKVSKEQLKALIKEELDAVMKEVFGANTGRNFDPNDRLDTMTRDTPLNALERMKKALGLGDRKDLTPEQIKRIYKNRVSTGKFDNEYSAYANYRRDPKTGKMAYSPLVALSLLVFFAVALQCMSTVAVTRKETASWRWPLFQLGYLNLLAWFLSFTVFQTGRFLGF